MSSAPNDSEPGSSFASLGGPPSFDADTSTVEVFGSSPGVTLTGGTTYGDHSGKRQLRIDCSTPQARSPTPPVSAYYIGQVGNRPDRWDDPSGVTPLKMAILTGPTRTVTENTASGDVGPAVTATDLDGDTLTYSVAATTDSDGMVALTAFSRDFALNAGSGQITVRPAVIDYETRSSYRVLYRVSDGEDAAGGTESTPAFDDDAHDQRGERERRDDLSVGA